MNNLLSKVVKMFIATLLVFSAFLPGVVSAEDLGVPPDNQGVPPNQGTSTIPSQGFKGFMPPPQGQQGQQGQQGFMPQGFSKMKGGNFSDSGMQSQGDMGPNDNASEKGKEMGAKGLSQMKKQTSRMQMPIKQMEKTIKRVQDAGYAVSQEVLDALAKAKTAVSAIENAADMDAAQTAMEDFNAFIDAMDTHMEALNMLANFPKILKQATKTLDRLNKMFEKAKNRLAQTDLNLTDAYAKVQTKVDGLKATLQQAQDLAKTGDAEGAFAKLEDEFFENIEDAFQSVGMLDALRNLSKVVKMVNKGIVGAEKLTAKLAKSGEDVAELNSIITASKAKLESFKTLLASKDFDPEVAVDVIEELNDLRADFEDAVEELTGENLHGNKSINFFGQMPPAMPKGLMQGPPEGAPGASGFEKMEF